MTPMTLSAQLGDAILAAIRRAVDMAPPFGESESGQTSNAVGRVVNGNPTTSHQAHQPLCVRDCGRRRDPAVGRGLCRICYRHVQAAGELDHYPTLPRGRKA